MKRRQNVTLSNTGYPGILYVFQTSTIQEEINWGERRVRPTWNSQNFPIATKKLDTSQRDLTILLLTETFLKAIAARRRYEKVTEFHPMKLMTT